MARSRPYHRADGKAIDTYDDRTWRKKAAKSGLKPFGIEVCNPASCFVQLRKWRLHKWYVDEKSRDEALQRLQNHRCNVYKQDTGPVYRKIDRT